MAGWQLPEGGVSLLRSLDVVQDEVIAIRAEGRLHASQAFHEGGAREEGGDYTDGEGLAERQAAGDRAGMIVQFLDTSQDLLACMLADLGTVVKNP
jgi:hypothetical protein